jgi:serine-type D-Ala-D-Ala carboxypeptidase/endopeptidase (penicillin-binding protein 4)
MPEADAAAERAEFEAARSVAGDEAAPVLHQSAPHNSASQQPSGPPLQGERAGDLLRDLDDWAKKHGGRARGIARDLRSGEVLLTLDSDVAVNPASTQKLLTAGAALSLLGPAYRFKTEVWIEPGSESRLKAVVLVGGGAPDLTMLHLASWADDLRREGVSEIGALRVDQSLFQGSYWPPAYQEQPGEWAAFRAPISALALEKNTITLHVSPRGEGQPALLWWTPPGLTRTEGEVVTGPPKSGDPTSGDKVRWDLSGAAASLSSRLGGSLAMDAGVREYSRRVDDPRLGPGIAFREVLKAAKIEVRGSVELTTAVPREAKRWGLVRSAPLSVLLRELGKDSDNFSAEMLAVALSEADQEGPKGAAWSTERGMKVLHRWLEKLGLHPEKAVLRNGSGLFGANKVSCELIVGVLREMARGSSAGVEYQSQLSIGGVDGTLRERFGRAKWAQRVRAKTGTLRDTDALAGYIYPNEVGFPIAFSIVVSGVNGQHGEARKRIDRVVQSLAETKSEKALQP